MMKKQPKAPVRSTMATMRSKAGSLQLAHSTLAASGRIKFPAR